MSKDKEKKDDVAEEAEPEEEKPESKEVPDEVAAEPAEESAPAKDETAVEEDQMEKGGFQLPRVFALMGLVLAILAIGGLMAVQNEFDDRVENGEMKLKVMENVIDEKMASLIKNSKLDTVAEERKIDPIAVAGIRAQLVAVEAIADSITNDERFSQTAREAALKTSEQTKILIGELSQK